MDGFCLTVEFPFGGPAISYSIHLFEIYLQFLNFYVHSIFFYSDLLVQRRGGEIKNLNSSLPFGQFSMSPL